MDTAKLNNKLINSYLALLKDMSTQNKLDLISKLTKAVNTDTDQEGNDFYKAFGGWNDSESAEELIRTIKDSRTFNRKIKEF